MLIRDYRKLEDFIRVSGEAIKGYKNSECWDYPKEELDIFVKELEIPADFTIDRINNPVIIYLLLDEAINDNRIERDKYFKDYYKLFYDQIYTDKIRIRFFNSRNGVYSGNEKLIGNCYYYIWDDIPVLVTRNSKKWQEEEHVFINEIDWISREEVRSLTMLSFYVRNNYGVYQLNHYIDIPEWLFFENVIDKNNKNVLSNILRIIRLINKNHDEKKKSFNHDFTYSNEVNEKMGDDIYKGINMNNNVELRTAMHFIKAGMLYYQGSILAEEAFMNFYFGIEGCLRIINKKILKKETFAINDVITFLQEKFPNEYFHEALKEFYENRISLVHPESDFLEGWKYFAFADDFLDNYPWFKKLLVYAICENIEEIYT